MVWHSDQYRSNEDGRSNAEKKKVLVDLLCFGFTFEITWVYEAVNPEKHANHHDDLNHTDLKCASEGYCKLYVVAYNVPHSLRNWFDLFSITEPARDLDVAGIISSNFVAIVLCYDRCQYYTDSEQSWTCDDEWCSRFFVSCEVEKHGHGKGFAEK